MTRSRSRRAARGAATVEMAITMLLIVPIFLYALFLDDLLRYRLSQQEAVVTTLWDFAVQDFDDALPTVDASAPAGSATVVQKNARLMFCDHESGSEHFHDPGSTAGTFADCTSSRHHVGAVVAHECWLNSAAHQITCGATGDKRPSVGATGKNDLTVGASQDDVWQQVQSKNHPNGGMFACTGNLVVENYLLPRTFLQEFAGKDNNLSKDNWRDKGGDVHSNAEKGDTGTAYFFESDQFALVVDSWARTQTQDIKPADTKGGSKDKLLWDDTNTVFTGNKAFGLYQAAATLFTTQLVTSNLLMPKMTGDPTTPHVSITPSKAPSVDIKQDQGQGSYFASPWSTGSTTYQQTYNARGDNYMGCQSAESC